RPENQPLTLAVEDALRLERGERPLIHEVLGQRRGFGAGVLAEELADDLIEGAAGNEAAAAQVPNEPFARAEVARQHCFVVLTDSPVQPGRGWAGRGANVFAFRSGGIESPKIRTLFGGVKLAPPRFQA